MYSRDCPSADELAAWAGGEGGRFKRWRLARHLSRCNRCGRRVEALAAAEDALGRYFHAGSYLRQPTCPELEQLDAYLQAQLPAEQQVQVSSHVTGCDHCSRLLTELRQWHQEPVSSPLSARFKADWNVGLAAERPSRRKLVAAVAMAGAAVGLVFGSAPLGQLWKMARPGAPSLPEKVRIAPQGSQFALMGNAPAAPVRVAFRYRPKGSAEIRELWVPFQVVPSLSSADDYALRIRPLMGGWLYVLQADSAARWTSLFPSPRYHAADNPVRSGVEVSIPPEGFWLFLDEREGLETIYVLHSQHSHPELERLALRAERGERDAGAELGRRLAGMCANQAETELWCQSFQFRHLAGSKQIW